MTDKNIKQISKKQFAFFKGVALALLSIILVLNMWYIARGITYPFVYAFGILSYLIFTYIYLQGMSYVLKGERLKIGFNLRLVGIILMFFATSLLVTAFYDVPYEMKNYNDFFKGLDYIKYPHFINLFKNKVAGGFIGISMFTALKKVGPSIPFVIGFFVLFIGLLFTFMKQIISFFDNIKQKAPKVKKEKAKKVKEPVAEEPKDEGVIFLKDNTMDIIKSASTLNEPVKENKPVIQPKPNPVNNNVNSQITPQDMTPSRNYQYGDNLQFRNNGVFVPAHFVRGAVPGDNQNKDMGFARPIGPEPVQEVAQPVETQPVEQVQEQPLKSEQLTFDFSEPKIDEALVTAQPVFNEPVVAKRDQFVPQQTAPVQEAPKKKKIKWVPPSSELLEIYETSEAEEANRNVAEERTKKINQILSDYRLGAEAVSYVIGPAITRYNIEYQPTASYKDIDRKITDFARALGGVNCRFVPVVEGSFYSGLEIPNAVITMVSFKDVYEALPDVKKHPLSIAFGKDIEGKVICADFDKFPHALVAGTTGSGKSIFIHSVISTLIMRNSPDLLKLVLVDPKRVEMAKYRDLPHLLCPIITDPTKVKPLLDKLVQEMNDRYDLLGENDVTQISEYNEIAEEQGKDKMPYIVAVLDEFGDLVQTCKEVTLPIVMLGQKARACGIHLMIATQSPTSDVITGGIKNNLPTHIALATANYTQSITILGEGGAEKLLGKGDMLVQSPLMSKAGGLSRLQGCYISGKEITRIANFLREHYPTDYDERFMNLEEEAEQEGAAFVAAGGAAAAQEGGEEARYQSVKEWVMSNQYMSISRIQRECSVGFNRAGRFFNRLVQEGIVEAGSEGNKGSKVLVHDANTSIDVDDVPVSDEQSF